MNIELLERARQSNGATCPTCNKHVQVYTRKLNSNMARALLLMYREARKNNNEWCRVGHLIVGEHTWPSGYPKLVWWGSAEKHPGKSDDGNSNGMYRLTKKGALFAKNKTKVSSHAVEYMSVVEEFVGDEINIIDALGKKFDYNELMQGIL